MDGAMRIDHDAAGRLLTRLGDIRTRARELAVRGTRLDQPLKFGDSWVAELMAGQLRDAGTARDGGLAPALRTFQETVAEVEALVRSATDRYQRTDEEAVAALNQAGSTR